LKKDYFFRTTSCFQNIEETFSGIQRYVVVLYDRSSSAENVDEERRLLLKRKGPRLMENIPPTSDALKLHVMRGAHTGGIIWGNALKPIQPDQEPSKYG
jgi:hypothetical protein